MLSNHCFHFKCTININSKINTSLPWGYALPFFCSYDYIFLLSIPTFTCFIYLSFGNLFASLFRRYLLLCYPFQIDIRWKGIKALEPCNRTGVTQYFVAANITRKLLKKTKTLVHNISKHSHLLFKLCKLF